MTDMESVQAVFKRISNAYGQISGLIHLLSIGEANRFAQERDGNGANDAKDVRSLFVLAKALEPTFKQNPRQSFVIAATGLGGDFASVSLPDQSLYVQQAGVVGIIKSLAKRKAGYYLQGGRFRVESGAFIYSRTTLAEAFAGDKEVEVGYFNESRVALEAKPTPLCKGGLMEIIPQLKLIHHRLF